MTIVCPLFCWFSIGFFGERGTVKSPEILAFLLFVTASLLYFMKGLEGHFEFRFRGDLLLILREGLHICLAGNALSSETHTASLLSIYLESEKYTLPR
jgi:hypothetical protein